MEDLFDSLQRMQQNLEQINEKLDSLLSGQASHIRTNHAVREDPKLPEGSQLDVMTLLKLPDRLRKSVIAVSRLHEATAADVSKETGRERPIESFYLNQLVGMGYVRKRRKGYYVYFYIP